jgi:hypothetical protein
MACPSGAKRIEDVVDDPGKQFPDWSRTNPFYSRVDEGIL